VRIAPVAISPDVRAVIAAIAKTRSCVISKGFSASGGPVLPPNPSGSDSADGEVRVKNGASAAFIAFYTARAKRLDSRPASFETRAASAGASNGAGL
jgi:hypothetical protein